MLEKVIINTRGSYDGARKFKKHVHKQRTEQLRLGVHSKKQVSALLRNNERVVPRDQGLAK
eukprot:1099920-Pelagomonas_calceolata.AAC.1